MHGGVEVTDMMDLDEDTQVEEEMLDVHNEIGDQGEEMLDVHNDMVWWKL
ncbi:hypothetical protein Pyn_21421 [Prunus yedoensis var. nudiflora]|uniref:Uncharacterized protein n=1 Tax=Prunus yedoensis var. nudiflora TaxID=2094558 RepID=A0A314YT79_PRUYE|nr:hypothetical protein Pyn_21421 [Prunus yedoensis var. nudiflora]